VSASAQHVSPPGYGTREGQPNGIRASITMPTPASGSHTYAARATPGEPGHAAQSLLAHPESAAP
jgi:hypothetical protein